MDKEQAIKMVESKWWVGLHPDIITGFQLFEPMLCMDFSVFHENIEKSLGRPVFTHEFGLNIEGLQKEFLGEKEKSTFEEVLGLIPQDKRVVILANPKEGG